jgi:SagB-type dehydrogenase family enzyme
VRLVRHPDLLLCWSGRDLLVQNLESKLRVRGGPELAALLAIFDRPREPRAAARRVPGYDPELALAGIRKLREIGFLLTEKAARHPLSRLRAFRHNLASAHYHAASRDLRYLDGPAALRKRRKEVRPTEGQPPIFKRYPSSLKVKLAAAPRASGTDLEGVLHARRTVRMFSRRAVSLSDLGRIVRGTWGTTGVFTHGPFGPLLAKTSPSGGALHPIECYVIAWNVAGLPAGLYHFDVRAAELRRLRRGDLRAAAVRAASGQRWVRGAAFLCVMTAVFERTLWKYRLENAYRTVWLDAGHLAQTFCLLATSRGLGAFTTAAIQDSFLDALIGLDGIREFPVYLCGAGWPAQGLRPSTSRA